MSRSHLRTARIDLAPMTSEHLPLLTELDADAEVLRFILGRSRTATEVSDFWGPICADADAHAVGLGWWIGRRRDDGAFLGWWDLSPAGSDDTRPARAEAGWRLARRHWRQGYATEAARSVFDHGFSTVGLSLVRAETMAVSAASRGVMASLGMHHVRTEHREWDDPLPGTEEGEVIYEITHEDWVQSTANVGR